MLKISGEALSGDQGFGIDSKLLEDIASEIKAVHDQGVQLAVVVGGGNYFRGSQMTIAGLERATADYVGMLATVMNAVCLQGAVEAHGVDTRVMSAIEMRQICEPYIRRRAVRHLEKGRVVIFGGGTGNPFFTTDTAAALRATEIDADVFIKATKVDGVYDSDPRRNPDAVRYSNISYRDVHRAELQVMDLTAITLCQENSIPVLVYNMTEPGNTKLACLGRPIGTLVSSEEDSDERD